MNILKSRGPGLATVLVAALALVLGSASAVQADVPAPENQVVVSGITVGVNPSQKIVYALYYRLAQSGGQPVPGTVIHVSTFSCGRFLQENKYPMYNGDTVAIQLSPDGVDVDLGENSVNKWVSRSIQYQVDIVQPGYDAFRLTGDITDYGTVDGKPVSSSRPSCEELANGGGSGTSSCVVNAPAKTVGQARVGRTVRARAPRTNGACGRVSYTWKANGHQVHKGKSYHLGKNLRGEKLTVKVSLSKGPDKTLRFGRVK